MSIESADIERILQFLRRAEALKHVPRTAWTSTGERESVAEHTWRLCLMAMVLGPRIQGIDLGRLLQICVVHDLGEAIGGDVSAVQQEGQPAKSAKERADLLTLLSDLPAWIRQDIVALWDEYEQATTPEARIAKGLDKLETILQHNQGATPDDFDFRFNLGYGAQYTADDPLLRTVRGLLDAETERRANEQEARRAAAAHGS